MISENMILQVMIMILQIMLVKRKDKHSHMDHAAAMIHGHSTWPVGRPLRVRPSPGRPPGAHSAAGASNHQKSNKGNHNTGSPSRGT